MSKQIKWECQTVLLLQELKEDIPGLSEQKLTYIMDSENVCLQT